MYDIIGDVHGHARLLKKMLVQLGYTLSGNSYSHPKRKAVFVGDFINRGPKIRETLHIIKDMVDNGFAYAILGNHEINAIIYGLKNKSGGRLVPQLSRGSLSLIKTLQEFQTKQDEWDYFLKWFRTLPLFLELGPIRVVHACWMDTNLEVISKLYVEGRIKKKTFTEIYKKPESESGRAIWQTTKGINLSLPRDLKVKNNKGVEIRTFRAKWWENPVGQTFRSLSFDNKGLLPKYTVPPQIIPTFESYSEEAPIVFVGHYCKPLGPHILKPNVCCIDSCVAGSKTLTAYTWNGEKAVDPKNLIIVY